MPPTLRTQAEVGDREAQYGLGYRLLFGTGMAQDAAQAVIWLTRAAQAEHAPAQNALANAYFYGLGVTPISPQPPAGTAAPLSRAWCSASIVWVTNWNGVWVSLRTPRRPAAGTARPPTRVIQPP